MSVVIAEGVVEVTADASRVPGDITSSLNGASPAIGAAGGLSGKAFLGGLVAAVSIGAVFSIGATIGQVLSDGMASAVDFSIEGIGLASDLAETGSAITQIFGTAAGDVEGFAERANTALGLTEQAALDGSKTFGIFGASAGLAGTDLTNFSTNFVTLASDLASFNNTSPDQAIVAIGAALRGEMEPIRQYGVLLDEATLKNEALKLGLISTTSEALTPQQKVLAAQSAIYAQTATQQGDFARTSEGLAGQQKILAASFEEAQAALGVALLPAMTELVTMANDNLMPMLDDLIAEIGPVLADAISESMPAFLELVEAVAPLVPLLIELGIEALPIILELITLLVPLMIDWAKNTTGIMVLVNGLFGLLSGDESVKGLAASLQATGGSLVAFSGWLGSVVVAAQRMFTGVVQWIGGVIKTIFELPAKAMTALSGIGATLYNAGRDLIQGFINGIRSMINSIGGAIGDIMSKVAGFFPHSPAKEGPFSGSGWTSLATSGAALMEQFKSKIDGTLDLGVNYSGGGFGGGSSAPALPSLGSGATSGGGNVYLAAGAVVIDAKSVRDFSDIVEIIQALPQVARMGRGLNVRTA